MSAVSLHDIAPRLARARDGLLAQRRHERFLRHSHRERELSLERLVAHRELQEVRAANTGNGRYIAARARKLKAAQRMLARHHELRP